jgi:hypothetical protein
LAVTAGLGVTQPPWPISPGVGSLSRSSSEDAREAILASLEDALRKGAKALVGNKGYRRFLRVERGSVSIDRAKAKEEARYDACGSGPPKERAVRGKYVLKDGPFAGSGPVPIC